MRLWKFPPTESSRAIRCPPFAVRGDIVAKELDWAAELGWSVARRFALLMCNVGDAAEVAAICERLRMPKKTKETAMAAIAASDAENLFSHSSAGIPAEKIVDKISRLDGFRNEQKMLDAAEVAQLHFGVASPNGGRDFPLPEILRRGLQSRPQSGRRRHRQRIASRRNCRPPARRAN